MTVRARVYLVRHGETYENRMGIVQGQLNTSLNSLGLEQAKLVADALRLIPFDVAYSSDLIRATKTAEIILAHRPGVKLHKQEELRERYLGEMQGKPRQKKKQEAALSRDKTMESSVFFAARTESWWMKYILDETASFPEKSEPYYILVTSHGGFIGTLIRSLIQSKRASCAPGVIVDRCLNTSVTIIDIEDERIGVITQYGDTSHMKELVGGTVETNVDEAEQ